MPKHKSKLPKIRESNWRESINESIKEGEHVEYLQGVLKKYEEYQRKFAKRFTDENSPREIYTFRATYLNKENVWREFEIAGSQYFERLAFEIIYSMDWDNDHMHGFEFSDYERSPDPLWTGSMVAFFLDGWEDDPHPTFKTNDIRICDFDYDKAPKMIMTFDYGDGHRFEVGYKGRRKKKKRERVKDFPKLVDLRGVPPEQYPDWEVVEKEGAPSSEKIHLSLDKSELVTLLTMLMTAETVINGNRTLNEQISKYENLYRKLLAFAFYKGLDDLIVWDAHLHDYFPTLEFEAKEMEFIKEYDDEVFWEELKFRYFWHLCVKKHGLKAVENKRILELMEENSKLYKQLVKILEEVGLEAFELKMKL